MTLLGKLLEHFNRVLQGEAKLLTASVKPALENALLRGIYHMILAVIGLYGALCLIGPWSCSYPDESAATVSHLIASRSPFGHSEHSEAYLGSDSLV